MKSKIGAIIFFLLLFVFALGLISFSTEFFCSCHYKAISDTSCYLFQMYPLG